MRVLGLGTAGAAATPAPVGAAASAAARDGAPVGSPLGADEERVLALAALAPSGHNTQPWAVRISERRRWTVGVDPARRLPAVDPADREIALSMGAFLECATAAAAALGLAGSGIGGGEIAAAFVGRDAYFSDPEANYWEIVTMVWWRCLQRSGLQ
jgi:hypothetical protein